jgi:hypothetical protein
MGGGCVGKRIHYAMFTVAFHGLNLTDSQLEDLRMALLAAAQQLRPDRQLEGDIEVELEEAAGDPVWVVRDG